MIDGDDTATRLRASQPVLDLVGVGFGPANLALAAFIEEERQEGRLESLTVRFLEQKEEFGWHPDMLIEGTRIQLSFLKDLVTLRNPRSRFSFLCYLVERQRLEDFVNLREFFPTRIEFDDYYRWVAEQVSDHVSFGHRVESIDPVMGNGGEVELLRITSRAGGTTSTHLARNLVVAPGGQPFVPAGVELDHERVFHCREFLGTVDRHYPDREAAYRFLVVGSGQSAAEIFQYLYGRFPNARVTAALRRYAYKPADESHFVNEIFHPGAVDFLYNLPCEVRSQVIGDHYDTNYSAVDLGLIQEIYSDLYDRRVQGRDDLEIRNLLELRSVDSDGEDVVAHFQDLASGKATTLEADGLVLATGYRRDACPAMLSSLQEYLIGSGDGCLSIERDYQVTTVPEFKPRLFLQGFCESTHGLSDTLLSVLPIRAREIVDSVDETTSDNTSMNHPAEAAMRLAETGGSAR